jgi:hypothetical protein
LSEDEKAAARRLFTSLVTPGEGEADTRARLTIDDQDPHTAKVIAEFSDYKARLLTTGLDEGSDRQIVDISHEALISSWTGKNSLAEWIKQNREKLRVRERIRARMTEWEEQDQDETLLLSRGRALEEGRELLADHGDVMIDDVKGYIDHSVKRA